MSSAFDIPTEPTSELQTVAIAIIFIFPALALLVVVLRAMGRASTRQFGLDDWLISIAMLLSLIQTLMSYLFIKTNFIGIRPRFIPEHDPKSGRIWNYGVQVLYNPILALVKASILVFLLKLFGQKDFIRRCIYSLTTVNVTQAIGVLFAVIFQCHPIAFAWDSEIRRGTCIDRRVLFTTMSALNILMDLLVLALPLWIFSDLRIPGKTKAALLVVFLLGFLVTITSVVRLTVLVQDLFGLPGSEGRVGLGFVTSAIETNLALITASAPALRPLFRGKSRYQLPDAETGIADDKNDKRGGSRRGSSKKIRPIQSRDIRVIRINDTTNPSLTADKETDLRGCSPRGSMEKAMTSANGIMRLSDVQREIDVLVKDLAMGPGGSYLLKRPTGYEEREREQQFRRDIENLEREVRSRQRTAAPRKAPSETNFSSYAAGGVVSAASSQAGPRSSPRTRPRTRTGPRPRTRNRDFGEERKSKYGDKRNGVLTPREPSAAWPF
ncbi:hypothetical protein PspLS_02054 [Pyricularia sp. CBS 133598]|nr:hypothetical protein PspLS_02054 [Pyricularia sp. CBS 133598]